VESLAIIATLYLGPVGAPLYCSTPDNPIAYSPETTPFVALPVRDYDAGSVQCGDLVYLRFSNGSTLMARALDAGPFSRFCVVQSDGSCPSIGVDVPSYFWPVNGISDQVELYNISAYARASRAGGNVDAPQPPLGDAPLPPAPGAG